MARKKSCQRERSWFFAQEEATGKIELLDSDKFTPKKGKKVPFKAGPGGRWTVLAVLPSHLDTFLEVINQLDLLSNHFDFIRGVEDVGIACLTN